MPTASGPRRSYELVAGWGLLAAAPSRVLRPRTLDEIRACFEMARRDGVPLGLRGAGNSYGDAAVNAAGHVLDVSRMDRILRWDPSTGIAELEPGVTIRQLWQRSLPDGWWPRVVPGTMHPTVAGALAMNVHGKNHFAAGGFGDACLEFDLVLPSGEARTASREREPELFHAAIGGLGLLGCFSRIVLQTQRVHSGNLRVQALRGRNLREVLDVMEARRAEADQLVGWIDAFPGGERSGRGLVHAAWQLEPGADRQPERTLRVAHQALPTTLLGFPRSEAWRVLRRFNNDAGVRLINAARYRAGCVAAARSPRLQSHARFAFPLDSLPGWKFAYGTQPGRRGLLQFQSFLPHAAAHDAWQDQLARCRAERLVPYLGVVKRHRRDPFWLTHALDGWSLALDFKVTPENRARLWEHCRALTETVLDAGGRFYLAKDLVLGPDALTRCVPPENLARFLELKRRLDPEGLLQTDLSRRVLGAATPPIRAPAGC